ncbi:MULTISPECIES: MarR family winged helix-turn-helix transcriptional regulator [Pelosinus]|uniref:Regulatory protein MarR n=1 Tax=Pelosinus fermentans B4 TaxID=1149862 RepID=I8RGR7_9FIRM|nr:MULTISPECIES: MarR family transcriptional regulator [Pelosinus]EIW18828.1 regulatory protein MarR [Pelosinus fermentans B4]EIW21962.1 transcriptional regulator, MarR family [Pelosinus fermentans A11]OAM95187.1 transcriptional regulator, MarR family [Pelosinus fermentans DSM 17108]SDR24497.1 DNA-binding transcriptional regulator, MarR family [Pelosinus fermentans]
MDFKLDDSLGFILNKTNTKLKNELFQRFKEYDVTPEQWAVLNCLWEQEGVTPKELADRIFKDKPNTNRILEKLQMKELIVRKLHPIDKRAYQIFLTDRGWALKKELIPKVMQLLETAAIGIEKHKILEMKKLLNQIYDNLT